MPIRTFQLIYPKKVDSHRKVTEKMIDEIIENDAGNFRYPVAIGHDAAMGWTGDNEPAAGRFSNLRKDENGMLLGDVTLQPEVDREFDNGSYPGWSVGIYKVVADDEKKNEDNLGWHMDHLALLGSVGAAFKDLQEVKGGNFSILNQSQQGMTVECFNTKKTLWLLQCVPKQPATVETPAASFSAPPNGGNDEMDAKEFEAYKAKQAEEMAQLKADNDKLKADNKTRQDAEITRRTTEFSGIKDTLLKAAAEKGVNEPARTALSEALNAYDAHYAGGVVSRTLFDAFVDVFSQLKPKVDSDDIDDIDEPDEFVLKQNWKKGEDIDALIN
jgi:hypothetical protein